MVAKAIAMRLSIQKAGVQTQSSQANDLQNWELSLPRLALSVYRLVQNQDNVIEWEIRIMSETRVLQVWQHN